MLQQLLKQKGTSILFFLTVPPDFSFSTFYHHYHLTCRMTFRASLGLQVSRTDSFHLTWLLVASIHSCDHFSPCFFFLGFSIVSLLYIKNKEHFAFQLDHCSTFLRSIICITSQQRFSQGR